MTATEWQPHDGGPRPVGYDEIVEVRFRAPPHPGQHAMSECFAGFFAWNHDGENDDIIEWRPIAAPAGSVLA